MSQPPDIHAFPATKLGAFLRAMEDPEGTGLIDADREREIQTIEDRLARPEDVSENGRGSDRPPDSSGG